MYGSAQCVMPFCSTFSIRATRKMSAWGLVTEKMPLGRERMGGKEDDQQPCDRADNEMRV